MPAFTALLAAHPSDEQYDLVAERSAHMDITFGRDSYGRPLAEVDASNISLARLIRDAVLLLVNVGLRPVRLIDQDAVNLADIAERIGVTREAVRKWSTGERGPGNFPPPLAPARRGAAFYSWVQVMRWLPQVGHFPEDQEAATLALANHLLAAAPLVVETADGDLLAALP